MRFAAICCAVFMVGCSNAIPGYHIRTVAQKCGGIDNIYSVNTLGAGICIDGRQVSYLVKSNES